MTSLLEGEKRPDITHQKQSKHNTTLQNMRVSVAALALLLADTRAFVPAISSRLTPKSKMNQEQHSSLVSLRATSTIITCPTPHVTSTTPILADSDQMKNIMEARRCIIEIDLAADRARDYVTHLDMRVSDFVKDPSTSTAKPCPSTPTTQ